MTSLFEHVDSKERKRVGKKLRALAEKLAEPQPISPDEQAALDRAAEFRRGISDRLILKDYASLNEEPVKTGGMLVSPALIAYGRRWADEMARHAAESDKRKRKEAGDVR